MAQVFKVTLMVEVNTLGTVSETEVKGGLEGLLEEFGGGTARVTDIEEYN